MDAIIFGSSSQHEGLAAGLLDHVFRYGVQYGVSEEALRRSEALGGAAALRCCDWTRLRHRALHLERCVLVSSLLMGSHPKACQGLLTICFQANTRHDVIAGSRTQLGSTIFQLYGLHIWACILWNCAWKPVLLFHNVGSKCTQLLTATHDIAVTPLLGEARSCRTQRTWTSATCRRYRCS